MPLYDRNALNELDDDLARWQTTRQQGVDRFPERYDEFSTLSGVPIEAALHALRMWPTPTMHAIRAFRANIRLRAASMPPAIVAGCGPCACLPVLARPRRPMHASSICSIRARPAFRSPSTCPRSTATTPTRRKPRASLASVAWLSLRLRDMEILLDGLPLADITTSMTINSPAAIIWAMYIAAAEKRGVARQRLGGTLQNDILKEYIAQKEFIFPPRPSMRLVTDTVEFSAPARCRAGIRFRSLATTSARRVRRPCRNWPSRWPTAWNMCAGQSSVGLMWTTLRPRISFFFNAHNDFFEEIAKYRAARRIWAHEMRETFGAKNPRAWLHALPHPDRGREPDRAAAAQQRGTRGASRHWRQCWAAPRVCTPIRWMKRSPCPGEEAVTVALRTQQIIAHESGVTNTVDPLGGSYFVEALTDEVERQARRLFPPD